MNVIINADISGTRDGKAWPPRGTEVDLPEREARDMIHTGSALEATDENRDLFGNGTVHPLLDLAGAPEARDITAGQPDTNLSRARTLARKGTDEARKIVRKAAKDTHMDDEHTVAQADPDAPVVGDDKPNPTDGERDSATQVETATASTAGVETATVDANPARRAR